MCRKEKWAILSRLIDELAVDPTLTYTKMNIEKICYASHLGYSSWIFKCNGVYVALSKGFINGYYFHMPATILDVIRGKLAEFYDKVCYFVDNGVWIVEEETSCSFVEW